ncbi:unnamed protein product [Strongylus vulgaris]|uniref:Uncharacterized protein n=1 Tax=Strongylus vulgaris TaxID=40348 RepID=A0A3P7IN24_STRVU|nr:unnamed protein product [Strongylus vulgaris]
MLIGGEAMSAQSRAQAASLCWYLERFDGEVEWLDDDDDGDDDEMMVMMMTPPAASLRQPTAVGIQFWFSLAPSACALVSRNMSYQFRVTVQVRTKDR